MGRAGAIASSLAWAGAYAVSIHVGRSLTMPGETLALVWPACGVATLWLLGRRGPVLGLDLALLGAVTMAVNAGTGLVLSMSAWFALVNCAQALIGATLLRRLSPELWLCGGTATFDSVGRLYRMVTAAVVSSFVAALIAAVGLGWFIAQPTPIDLAIHWGRNIYGFLAVVGLLHLVAHAVRFRGQIPPVLPRERRVELVALCVVTMGIFGVAFLQSSLPLAYVPAAVTIWAGLRFSPVIVAVHGTAAGIMAIVATIAGVGPFALVEDAPTRGLLVQLLITILLVKGLSLSAVRSHQNRLLDEVEAGSREATAQAALLSTIMDTIQPGLVVLDDDGVPQRTNEPARSLLAMHPSEAEPATPYRTITGSPDEGWSAVWKHLASQEVPPPFDLQLDGPDGRLVVEVRPAVMREGGDRPGTVVLLTDVTEERAARDGLTGFAGTIAHDLRGPLAGVKGWSHALADELETGAADLDLASAMARRVVTATSRMDDLIGDLLAHAVSRDGALRPTTLSLDRIVLEVRESLGSEGSVVLQDLAAVHADEALLRHLFTNLVGNALKYVAPNTVPTVSLSARNVDDMVEVRVCDNGIGIPAEERLRIFDQFHRVHESYPGTGLGLAICRTIVERHRGEIWAEPHRGGGTCIAFTLPAPPRGIAPAPRVTLGGARVGPGPGSQGPVLPAPSSSPVVA